MKQELKTIINGEIIQLKLNLITPKFLYFFLVVIIPYFCVQSRTLGSCLLYTLSITRSLKHFLFLFISLLCSANVSFAQLTVESTMTPEQYVQSLVGSGIVVSNVTYSGNANQIGTFNGANSNIGFNSGVILSAGPVDGMIGVAADDDAGQPGSGNGIGTTANDLLTVAQSVNTNPSSGNISSVYDIASLEFDFVPSSNVASFNFVFSSDEYELYINSEYNDVFAFFVSGPGITGPFNSPPGFPGGSQNVAVLPGTTTPITISTIYPANANAFAAVNPAGLNAGYYVDNTGGTSHTHNGFTTPIPVELSVECGETYHFKFAIADGSDNFLNTSVFIEAGSFVSDAVDVTVATVSGDSTIVEGCTDANFYFTRPEGDAVDTLIVNYQIGGEAIEGEDYNFLPDSIVFLPGQDSVTVNLSPIQDGLDEGFESVTISVELVNICGDTIISEGIIYIGDGPILNITESDTTVLCANDAVPLIASASGGYAPYTYEWTDTDGNSIGSGDTIYQAISENGSIDVLVTVTDFCNFSGTDTVTLTQNQTLEIDEIFVGPATCEPDGFVSAIVSGATTTPEHGVYYSWLDQSGNDGPAASVWIDLPSGWYYISVEDAVCTVEDSAFIELLAPPIAALTANPQQGCAPLLVSFDYSDSQNANEYILSFGDGSSQSSNTIEQMSQTYQGASSNTFDVQLVVLQGENCSDTAQLQIVLDICGCTDQNALNYNSDATADDGSCIYPVPPEPIVSAPNVFTPNNDTNDLNEVFALETKNLQELQLIVFNRWGNIVFNETSVDPDNVNPSWNGEIDSSGKEAEEGVYFYKYIAVGLEDQFSDTAAPVVEGHGFIHLVRK